MQFTPDYPHKYGPVVWFNGSNYSYECRRCTRESGCRRVMTFNVLPFETHRGEALAYWCGAGVYGMRTKYGCTHADERTIRT